LSFIANLAAHAADIAADMSQGGFFLHAVFNPANPDCLGQYCGFYKYASYLAVLYPVFQAI
jgi:hypothetical protein